MFTALGFVICAGEGVRAHSPRPRRIGEALPLQGSTTWGPAGGACVARSCRRKAHGLSNSARRSLETPLDFHPVSPSVFGSRKGVSLRPLGADFWGVPFCLFWLPVPRFGPAANSVPISVPFSVPFSVPVSVPQGGGHSPNYSPAPRPPKFSPAPSGFQSRTL